MLNTRQKSNTCFAHAPLGQDRQRRVDGGGGLISTRSDGGEIPLCSSRFCFCFRAALSSTRFFFLGQLPLAFVGFPLSLSLSALSVMHNRLPAASKMTIHRNLTFSSFSSKFNLGILPRISTRRLAIYCSCHQTHRKK